MVRLKTFTGLALCVFVAMATLSSSYYVTADEAASDSASATSWLVRYSVGL